MNYIIGEEGLIGDIKNREQSYLSEKVFSITNEVKLKKEYCLNIISTNEDNNNAEIIKEIHFDCYPSKEQVMFHMLDNGVNRISGYAQVIGIYKIDLKDEKNCLLCGNSNSDRNDTLHCMIKGGIVVSENHVCEDYN